jgi:predicted Zn-dependent peptidase
MPEVYATDEGISIYGFRGVMSNILRIDFVLEGGRWTEPAPLLADSATRLMKSGTSSSTAFQLETSIDQLGATIKMNAGYHAITFSIFTMRRYLPKLLDLLRESWTDCQFPESEVAIYKKNELARLRTSEKKAEFVAEMAFKEQLFGKHHPYGYAITQPFIEALNRDNLIHFYQSQIRGIKPTIFIGGRYGEKEIGLLNDFMHSMKLKKRLPHAKHSLEEDLTPVKYIHRKGLSQVSIMMGKRLFNRLHPDYPAFTLLNTVFGGYFGSRLMLNIREDKGYTYGIYSGLQTYRHDGAFYIQTDTSKENLNACLHEIKTECQRIRNDLITADELSQAKNYLLGKFLTRMDGPFAQMEFFKNYQIEKVPIEYFNDFANIILDTKPATLQHLAQQYLDYDSFIQVIAGS